MANVTICYGYEYKDDTSCKLALDSINDGADGALTDYVCMIRDKSGLGAGVFNNKDALAPDAWAGSPLTNWEADLLNLYALVNDLTVATLYQAAIEARYNTASADKDTASDKYDEAKDTADTGSVDLVAATANKYDTW